MRYTPGPWVYREELRANMSAIEGRDVIIAGIPNESDVDLLAVQRANAHLIEASPDMLEALQVGRLWLKCSYITGGPVVPCDCAPCTARRQIDVAIDKATKRVSK